MPPPSLRIRDRWAQDLSEDREARDLREQSGRKDLTRDRGTRDIVNDLGRREIEQLGAKTTLLHLSPVATSISGGVLTVSPRQKSRRVRRKRLSST